jgi:hypothetical protein
MFDDQRIAGTIPNLIFGTTDQSQHILLRQHGNVKKLNQSFPVAGNSFQYALLLAAGNARL